MRGILTAIALLFATGAVAQELNADNFTDRVWATAFDPSRFFAERPTNQQTLIEIRYRGDDYDYPVYAVAIGDGCVPPRVRDCLGKRVARIVRSPVPPMGAERPRWRGAAVLSNLRNRKPRDQAELARALDTVGLEWMEADLAACPGALAELSKASEATWIAPHIVNPTPQADLDLVLHADKIEVAFKAFLRDATYYGYIAEGTPAAWANGFVKLLEPCWKPASAPKPWLRAPATR